MFSLVIVESEENVVNVLNLHGCETIQVENGIFEVKIHDSNDPVEDVTDFLDNAGIKALCFPKNSYYNCPIVNR